jgi:preprotein translocase subunit SecD
MKRLSELWAFFAILAGLTAVAGCRNDVASNPSPEAAKKALLAQNQREKLVLELVMLANAVDDKEAIEDAKKYFEDPVNRAEIEYCQKEGLPPSAPRQAGSKVLAKYPLNLANGNKSLVTYRWVEIGTNELLFLDLDNAAESDSKRNRTWKEAKIVRSEGKASVLEDMGFRGRKHASGALYYSRECRNRKLTEDERAQKKVEYFVLIRNPEIDPNDERQEKETPTISEKLVTGAKYRPDEDFPSLEVQLNNQGAKLFATILRNNEGSYNKDGSFKFIRRMGIIIDNQLHSAPTVHREITTGRFQIFLRPKRFAQKEIDDLVERLCSNKAKE